MEFRRFRPNATGDFILSETLHKKKEKQIWRANWINEWRWLFRARYIRTHTFAPSPPLRFDKLYGRRITVFIGLLRLQECDPWMESGPLCDMRQYSIGTWQTFNHINGLACALLPVHHSFSILYNALAKEYCSSISLAPYRRPAWPAWRACKRAYVLICFELKILFYPLLNFGGHRRNQRRCMKTIFVRWSVFGAMWPQKYGRIFAIKFQWTPLLP